MKTADVKEPPRRQPKPRVSLLDQVIELVDWTSRHPVDTPEQKEAVALKEHLETWKREREQKPDLAAAA